MNEVVVAVRAGALYALIVIMIGFVLGTTRVLLVVPRFGETVAVAAVLKSRPFALNTLQKMRKMGRFCLSAGGIATSVQAERHNKVAPNA